MFNFKILTSTFVLALAGQIIIGPSSGNGGGGPGSVVWGAITGTLSDQTDLQTALDAKGATASPLSQFASTTSAQLLATISNETGTGLLVFGTSPVLTTPNLGVPSALTLTNALGLPIGGITGLGSNVGTWLGTAITGTPRQTVSTLFGEVATGATAIVFDDSPPQNTEGVEFMTQAITPTNASSILYIKAVMFLSVTPARTVSYALFQDTTADALAAGADAIANVSALKATLFYKMTAGTTSATTFKIRAGATDTSTVTFNGVSSARIFSTLPKSSIEITEVLP